MEINKFSQKIEQVYLQYEKDFFEMFVSKDEINLVKEVDKILDLLDLGDTENQNANIRGFNSFGIDRLIMAKQKLSRFSETLSEWITFHASRADFAYIWRKGIYAEDWLPVKTKLENEMKKVTIPDVENELIQKYLGEQYYSMFHRRRADRLISKIDSVDRMIQTINSRLRELARQSVLANTENFNN